MTPKSIKNISKMMSLVLRHRPERLHLTLDKQGWCEVDAFITAFNDFNGRGLFLDRNTLQKVVELNDKKRFALSEDSSKIRANQGHSIPIDLGYRPLTPPDVLYHGTAQRFLNSILKTGLEKRKRHHVHLSEDLDTARNVGQRHGKPVILTILAREMHEDGWQFFQSENGVWLVEQVFPKYLVR